MSLYVQLSRVGEVSGSPSFKFLHHNERLLLRISLRALGRISAALLMASHFTRPFDLGLGFSLSMSAISGLWEISNVSVYLPASAAWHVSLRLLVLLLTTGPGERRGDKVSVEEGWAIEDCGPRTRDRRRARHPH